MPDQRDVEYRAPGAFDLKPQHDLDAAKLGRASRAQQVMARLNAHGGRDGGGRT